MELSPSEASHWNWTQRHRVSSFTVLVSIALLFGCNESQPEAKELLPEPEKCVEDLSSTQLGNCACEGAYPLRGPRHASLSRSDYLSLCEPSAYVAICKDGSSDFSSDANDAYFCGKDAEIERYLRVPDG